MSYHRQATASIGDSLTPGCVQSALQISSSWLSGHSPKRWRQRRQQKLPVHTTSCASASWVSRKMRYNLCSHGAGSLTDCMVSNPLLKFSPRNKEQCDPCSWFVERNGIRAASENDGFFYFAFFPFSFPDVVDTLRAQQPARVHTRTGWLGSNSNASWCPIRMRWRHVKEKNKKWESKCHRGTAQSNKR